MVLEWGALLHKQGTTPLGGARVFSSFFSTPRKSEGCETKSTPNEALKSTAWGKLAFDERVVLHRVSGATRMSAISV